MFAIKSSSSDLELIFSAPRPDYFTVELQSREFRAIREVWAYTDAQGLAVLFSKLAAQERPWVGAESWASLEGEFSLSAACSARGEVALAVSVSGLPGALEEWGLSATLITELGQLPSIAAAANRFFCQVGGN